MSPTTNELRVGFEVRVENGRFEQAALVTDDVSRRTVAKRVGSRRDRGAFSTLLDCLSSSVCSMEKMMAIIARTSRALSMSCRKFSRENRVSRSNERIERKGSRFSVSLGGRSAKAWFGALAGIIGGCGVVLYRLNESSVKAGETIISLPHYPWAFNGVFASFDHAAVRRGWTVYRNVCRACHSLEAVRFLDLVDVSHTLEEVKEIAAEFEVEDGPDKQGNYYTRPAKLNDLIPSPYPNEEAARAANFGAYPPDLTYIVFARNRGIDYVFALLTGWMDPPAGIHPDEGRYFNVYFPGGFTTMPKMFYEGMVEYEDGTPATESQMAKDVVEFLTWAAAPEHDTQRIMTLKCIGIFLILIVALAHIHRRNWSHLRSRRIAYVPNSLSGEPRSPVPLFGQSADKRSKRGSELSNR